MSNEQQPPDEIWLQWHGDQEPEHCNGEPGEVTWSRDAVFRHDIEYRRVNVPSPEVLDKALRLMAHDLVDRGEIESDDELDASVRQVCRDYLAMAEAEIAAAKKGGAK